MLALVTPEELLDGGRRAAVVDARTRSEYDRGHIPGAIHMDWEDWCAPPPEHASASLRQPGYWGLLADEPARLAERLAGLGLEREQPIVVYADGVSSRGRDGRIAWMLLYYGARQVALLDGGWSRWRRRGGRASTERTVATPGRFPIVPHEHRRVRLSSLRSWHEEGELPLLLDTRSRREFRGFTFRYLPRMGRIPGSLLLPFEDLFDRDGCYVRADAYHALLPEPARQPRACLAYCEVGVRASTAALLHELYTGRVLPVYDGSLMEWALHPELPVAHDRADTARGPRGVAPRAARKSARSSRAPRGTCDP